MLKTCVLLAGAAFGVACVAAAPAARAADLPASIDWDNIKSLPDLFTGSWQMFEPPRSLGGGPPGAGVPVVRNAVQPKGPIGTPGNPYPLTPQAQKMLETLPPGGTSMDIGTNCGIQGMPGVMTSGAMPLKFMAAPGLISIWAESAGVLRFVRMDGRQPDPDPDPTYLGNSVGHWEGDTLVIDSRGFVDDVKLDIGNKPGVPGPNSAMAVTHGPNMRIVERIRLTGKDSMQITRTVYDDTLYTQPVVSVSTYKRFTTRNAEPQEWFCSKNYDALDTKTGDTLYNVQGQSR